MTIKAYITIFLPDRFKVHPAWRKVVSWIWSAEETGENLFSQEAFANPRDRAALALPYPIKNLKERTRVLNILELMLLKHRELEHGENWDKRIIELQETTVPLKEEADILTDDKNLRMWSG